MQVLCALVESVRRSVWHVVQSIDDVWLKEPVYSTSPKRQCVTGLVAPHHVNAPSPRRTAKPGTRKPDGLETCTVVAVESSTSWISSSKVIDTGPLS